MGVHLSSMHLMGVHLGGVHLTGVHLPDVYCYGSVKNGFDSAILTKIPRMKKEERAGSSTDD